MIKLNVIKILEKKGLSKYWLWKNLNMSYQNFNKMVNNETKSVRFEILEAMCSLLDCTPNDLLIFDDKDE